jgi:hypothetical protein
MQRLHRTDHHKELTMATATTTTTKHASTAERVAALRDIATTDPLAAQDATWAWIERLGKQLPAPEADDELSEIFTCGMPGDAIDGQSEGILVGWTKPASDLDLGGRLMSGLGRRVTGLHVPWVGKRFDRAAKRGTNSLTPVALIAKLIAPRYAFKRGDAHLEGFEMTNWVEPGKLDPDTSVYVIDYESAGNPWPFNHVRDELVEVVPHTYLGKMLWRQGDGEHRLTLYFALKTSLS